MSKVKIKIKSIDNKQDDNIFGMDFRAKGEAKDVMSVLIAATASFAIKGEMDEKTLIKYVKQYYKKMEEEYDENKIQLG